jgi:peptidoglycan hydrolase-like protein with peptidoglycan-binding domain
VNDESPETPPPPATRDRWWLIAIVAVVALAAGIGIGFLIGNDNGGSSETAVTTTTVANGGATPQQIATAQKALADVGCYTGPVDGIYGPVTDAAVRSFQQAKGLLDRRVVLDLGGGLHVDQLNALERAPSGPAPKAPRAEQRLEQPRRGEASVM